MDKASRHCHDTGCSTTDSENAERVPVRETDVLSGRGRFIIQRQGNLLFEKLIDRYAPQHVSGGGAMAMDRVAVEVMTRLPCGTRMMASYDRVTDTGVPMTDKACRAKIGGAIRYRNSQKRRSRFRYIRKTSIDNSSNQDDHHRHDVATRASAQGACTQALLLQAIKQPHSSTVAFDGTGLNAGLRPAVYADQPSSSTHGHVDQVSDSSIVLRMKATHLSSSQSRLALQMVSLSHGGEAQLDKTGVPDHFFESLGQSSTDFSSPATAATASAGDFFSVPGLPLLTNLQECLESSVGGSSASFSGVAGVNGDSLSFPMASSNCAPENLLQGANGADNTIEWFQHGASSPSIGFSATCSPNVDALSDRTGKASATTVNQGPTGPEALLLTASELNALEPTPILEPPTQASSNSRRF